MAEKLTTVPLLRPWLVYVKVSAAMSVVAEIPVVIPVPAPECMIIPVLRPEVSAMLMVVDLSVVLAVLVVNVPIP